MTIPAKETKLLFLASGGMCAFPGCGRRLLEPGTTADGAVVIAEAAHIVADSRQGPRGRNSLSPQERNRHTNLILLCPMHHTVVDSQTNTHSVQVLLRMKQDHEARIELATRLPAPTFANELVRETIHSTLLAVTHLPQVVFSAPCGYADGQERALDAHITYPERREVLLPRLLRGGRLLAFQDLRDPEGPFAAVVEADGVELLRAEDLWRDPEGHRRYITLLNRALSRHTARLRLRYDRSHGRYYFAVIEAGKSRRASYRTLTGRWSKRRVAWSPTRRSTGEQRDFWWHLAAKLRFEHVADVEWCFSIRPERHLTLDGETPLPPQRIGRRVTRLKARMYNDLYLSEVHFWRDYLSSGQPRFVLDFGSQSTVVDSGLLSFDVEWPGIPDDDKPFQSEAYQDDLFTVAELDLAESGNDLEWEDEGGPEEASTN